MTSVARKLRCCVRRRADRDELLITLATLVVCFVSFSR